jgi:predicted ATPase/class 3 adenylate cyclase
MTELPSGIVTFLFTDIEGSTRLLTRLGNRYVDLLAEHQRVLREAFDRHDGREVHTEGDAFFVAFARATDAIAAAVCAQRALGSQRWPEEAGLRVRVGIHTGEAAIRDGDYVGLDVHRAARICSAAHGGQVLISGVTREIVGNQLPAAAVLRDLGEHRLKDLEGREHLFQLLAAGLGSNFPPPRTLPVLSPVASGALLIPNRTIGREDDIRAIEHRVLADDLRLLTLTGPGGVGKTRLALEVARVVEEEFVDGVCFVSLAALRRAEDIPAALVQRLAVTPIEDETAQDASMRFLSAKRLLLVLDNLEHLLRDVRFVSDLLLACPHLTVLATSRAPLVLAIERRYPVAPLALPPDDADLDVLARAPAVALFTERARVHEPGFALNSGNVTAVVEICRRLEGLPLAIELAAARCGLLAPAEIAERLDLALATLGRGPRDAPARQQTLRAAIDWSFELLDQRDRELFTAFAVFAGGSTPRAAAEVTGAAIDTLDSLVAKSLLERRGRRLAMLETVRQYAAERLHGRGEQAAIRRRHLHYYLRIATQAETGLLGCDRAQWLSQLDAETDNFRAALRWSLRHREGELGLALAGVVGLAWYWAGTVPFDEGLAWIASALTVTGRQASAPSRAKALLARAFLCSVPEDWENAAHAAQQANTLYHAMQDARGSALAMIALAATLRNREQMEQSAVCARDALDLAKVARDDFLIAEAIAQLVPTMSVREAQPLLADAERHFRLAGNRRHLSIMLSRMGYTAMEQGRFEAAGELLAHASDLARELGEPFPTAHIRGNEGLAALLRGDDGTAAVAFHEELEISRQQVFPFLATEAIGGLGAAAALRGQAARAARLSGAFLAHTHGTHPLDRRIHREILDPARAREGTNAWDRYVEEGQRMTLDQATDYALLDDAPMSDRRGAEPNSAGPRLERAGFAPRNAAP